MKKKEKVNNGEIKFEAVELKKASAVEDDYKKIITFVIILLIMGLLFGGLYFFNAKFVTKDEFQSNEETSTTTVKLDTSLILASDIFNISDGFVMLYDMSDETSSFLYDNLVTNYKGEEKVYKVDLSNQMNKKYYNKDKEENRKPESINDLVITRNTLIELKKGKVISYITDKNEIIEKLTK